MRLPASVTGVANRFNQFSLRERVFVSAALLASLYMLWDFALMRPLALRQADLAQQLTQAQSEMRATADLMDASVGSDASGGAFSRLQALQTRLDAVTARFAAAGAGLIPPERMTQVMRDVLSRCVGLKLISLRSAPVRSLLPATEPDGIETAPYVHPVDLVVEGSYADALGYLKSLESLPWSFYWNTFELKTVVYPQNRIRIELITLSMDKPWLGV